MRAKQNLLLILGLLLVAGCEANGSAQGGGTAGHAYGGVGVGAPF